MKGMELSRRYFMEIYMPAIKEGFPQIIDRMAAGLAGEGSECFGYDDVISRDHDFGPSCCIWLIREDYEAYGESLQRYVDGLPKEFMGFKALNKSEWGDGRRGILNMDDWYYRFLGMEEAPSNLYDWRLIPETALAAAVNGEVFMDRLGRFTEIRETLKNYFPEDIRKNKIATRCMKIAQSGQYNFSRCMKRNETVAARMAETEFIDEAVHMIYLLNREYKPFYKWMHRRMKELPVLGEKTYDRIKMLVEGPLNEVDRKTEIIESVCGDIITELKRQYAGLENIGSDFLLDYGPAVQQEIEDEKLRNWSPWLD